MGEFVISKGFSTYFLAVTSYTFGSVTFFEKITPACRPDRHRSAAEAQDSPGESWGHPERVPGASHVVHEARIRMSGSKQMSVSSTLQSVLMFWTLKRNLSATIMQYIYRTLIKLVFVIVLLGVVVHVFP